MRGRVSHIKHHQGTSSPTKGDGTGYGFVVDDAGKSYFFHKNSVIAGTFEQIQVGTEIEFEEEPSPRGPRAGQVRVA